MDQKILIIDAHPVYGKKMEGFLKGLTFQNVFLDVTGSQGIQTVAEINPDIVLLSGALPDIRCSDVCREIKKINSNIAIIVQIGLFSTQQEIDEFRLNGADVVLDRKEKNLLPLEQAIKEVLSQKTL